MGMAGKLLTALMIFKMSLRSAERVLHNPGHHILPAIRSAIFLMGARYISTARLIVLGQVI